jgi:hypothetical protein
MDRIAGLTINEAEYELLNGKGKIAVFLYSGESDPSKILDFAIKKYVGNNGYYELIDAHLDNPWMRVIVSDINNMNQEDFDAQKHKLTPNT